jgi:UDP-2,3-diacylglucosamine pyrophosphatase LpxH
MEKAMLSIDDFLKKSKRRAKIHKNFRGKADKELSQTTIVCIPDMHLLEKGPNDDFFDTNQKYVDRFLSFLDFLVERKEDIQLIQLGDMFDLWQARGNTNLIYSVYPDILGLMDEELRSIYVIGNHDIDIYEWYKEQEKTFNREWRHLLSQNEDNKRRVIFEHGFQADFFNNQDSWSGAIGREVTEIVGYMEYLCPDIDIILSESWERLKRTFTIYNSGLTPKKNPGFSEHEYFKYYIDLMEKYNAGDTDDSEEPTDLALAVIAHTHKARLVSRPRGNNVYYLMDCGSWVNGGHEFGIIAGNEFAICEWNTTSSPFKPRK